MALISVCRQDKHLASWKWTGYREELKLINKNKKYQIERKKKGIFQECHHDRKWVYLNILITSHEEHLFDDNHITNSTWVIPLIKTFTFIWITSNTSDFSYTSFHILDKQKATHSNILAWGIPWTVLVYGVTKSWRQLSDFHFRFHISSLFFFFSTLHLFLFFLSLFFF